MMGHMEPDDLGVIAEGDCSGTPQVKERHEHELRIAASKCTIDGFDPLASKTYRGVRPQIVFKVPYA